MSIREQKKPVRFETFFKYTVLFIGMSLAIFSVFFIQGKTFIWQRDGFHQHYPFFREYLNILRNFFQTGHWQSWNWNIGLGADTLISYGYYVVGDPFVYLGLLFPKGAEEFAFHAIMFVRIWCVGASFLFYAKKMNLSHLSALMGSIMYAFSHPVIYNVVRHPFFIHPMIFFPLLCLGIEKVFKKESGFFFVLMVAISAASNFYFFYMLTWMILVYALIRYISLIKKNSWQTFLKWFAYFVGLYFIGLFIASGIFVPLVYGFLNASRSPGPPPISLLVYPLRYYGLLIINSLTPGTIFWTIGGLSILSVFSLPFLVHRRKQRSGLFWTLTILGIMLLFPIFGSFMNGLSGPYNRFTFIVPFYMALATIYFMENIHDLKDLDMIWIRRLMLAYSVLYISAAIVTKDFLLYLTPVLLGWVIYGFIQYTQNKKWTIISFQRLMTFFVLLNLTVNGLIFYSPFGKNAVSGTEDYGTIDEAYLNVFDGVDQNLPTDSRYRIGVTSHNNNVRNQYAYINKSGTNSYTSLTNGAVAEFAQFLEASSYQIIQPLRNGIDDRRIVNQALGIKYILTEEKYADYLPSDYTIRSDLSALNSNMLVAETENEAPFAYVETNGLSYTDAQKLHPVQRERLLANAVILEDHSEVNLEAPIKLGELKTHKGHWAEAENIHGQENLSLNQPMEITVDEANSQMTLTFDRPEELVGQEVFIYFEDIEFTPPEKFLKNQASTAFRLKVNFNKQNKGILQSDRYTFSSYFKRENILIHLNEVSEAEDTLTVTFQNAGDYSFGNVSVISRPFDEEQATKEALVKKENALEIKTFTDEQIKGSIQASKDGMLVTNIPYTPGWQAYVDGQKVPTEKVNIGFVGLPISAGEHAVEFVYQTPYLKLGVVMSVLGIVALVGYEFIFRRYLK